jgi:hypothetical protein
MSVVMRFRLEPSDWDRDHLLKIVLVDPGGQEIRIMDEAAFGVRRPARPDRPAYLTAAVDLAGVGFPVAGDYELRLSVDGVAAGTIALFAQQQEG